MNGRTMELVSLVTLLVVATLCSPVYSQQKVVEFEITPAVRKELDAWKLAAAEWAADPEIVAAVPAANAQGPIAGMDNEAFLNGDQGHKVAFVEKTSSYIHKGKSKFDVPFDTLASWQGKPEADRSSHTDQIQISVPVLDPAAAGQGQTAGKAIGVLVIGIDLSHLEKVVVG